MSEDLPTEAKAGATFAGGMLLREMLGRVFRGGESWRAKVTSGLERCLEFVAEAKVKLDHLATEVATLKANDQARVERINASGEKRNEKMDAMDARLRQAEQCIAVLLEQRRTQERENDDLRARLNAHERVLIEEGEES